VLELEHPWDWVASDRPGSEPGADEFDMFVIADAIGYRQLNLRMFYEHGLDA
jgi:hypothetical protein